MEREHEKKKKIAKVVSIPRGVSFQGRPAMGSSVAALVARGILSS
jgi:hypothetical protein